MYISVTIIPAVSTRANQAIRAMCFSASGVSVLASRGGVNNYIIPMKEMVQALPGRQ